MIFHLAVGGDEIEPRDYQIDALKHALQNQRAVLDIPYGFW